MGAKEEKFLAEIQSDNAEVRFAASNQAGEMEAEVVGPLAKLLATDRPGVVKAATEALTRLVHAVGKEAGGKKRAEVVRELQALLGEGQPLKVRVLALRLLSLAGGDETVPGASKLIHHPELREEAAFCLERIPGKAATAALVRSYKEAKEDFKPRLLAALGHRRAEEAVGLCVEAMRSANKEVALAGVKAFGRIGRKGAAAVKWPALETLSEWEQIEALDGRLRYADAQVEQGNHAEAWPVYRQVLERPEEHWQCAAIIGIARMGTAEAAAAIFPKLKSPSRTIRLTAAKAWDGMK